MDFSEHRIVRGQSSAASHGNLENTLGRSEFVLGYGQSQLDQALVLKKSDHVNPPASDVAAEMRRPPPIFHRFLFPLAVDRLPDLNIIKSHAG
jgi:hypothetical protein